MNLTEKGCSRFTAGPGSTASVSLRCHAVVEGSPNLPPDEDLRGGEQYIEKMIVEELNAHHLRD